MNRSIIMKDRRLIEALDYIDDEYIASAALYKMRSYAESTRPLAHTAGQSVKKHWKHYLGFVACLLVLALATPLFGYLPEIINSIAASWGEGGETIDLSDTTTEHDSIETVYNIQTTKSYDYTYIPESEELHETVITPNYLKFVSDIESISEDKMLEIRKSWYETQWNHWFDVYYSSYSNNGQYTENEAKTKAEDKADAFTKNAEYDWFTVSIYNDCDENLYEFRYYGIVNDYVILVKYEKRFYGNNYAENKKIGNHSFYFKFGGEIYMYKDGIFNTIEEIYEQGLIDEDNIAIIHKRHNSNYESYYENWRKETYYQYFAEKGE